MTSLVTKEKKCLLCGSDAITTYLSLGTMVPANSFAKTITRKERKIPLGISFCHTCFGSQLTHTVDPTILFTHYAYFSSTSPLLVSHFLDYTKTLKRMFPTLTQGFIIDIGSNDGVLLKPLQKLGARILGIDPAKEVSLQAIQLGIPTIQEYFTLPLAQKIREQQGHASIITASNVFAHTKNVHNFIEGVKVLLDPQGIFVFEVKYMADVIEKNEFDVIYHEHVFSFMLHPLMRLFHMHDMKIFAVEKISIHGGSLRIFTSHKNAKFSVRPSVHSILKNEQMSGYTKLETYTKFAKDPPRTKKALHTLLSTLKNKGKRIVGYGASAKGMTLLQYAHIHKNLLEYIVDASPSKIGMYTPGTHIPIVSPDVLKTKKPDYILLLAWDHKATILKKESWFTKTHGMFILPIPYPKIVKE